jgi:thioredoxin-related protein
MPLSATAITGRTVLIAAALAGWLPARAWAQPTAPSAPTAAAQTSTQPAKANIYDTAADAKVQIAAAIEKAKRENQRVLVMFGGNWCGWCHKLHELFKSDKGIAKTLLYEYQLVLVDIGKFDKNLDIATGYGADLKKAGVPYLAVLDADGKALTTQDTGALEDGDHHDPKKVAAFLEKWKAEPRDAEKLLTDALSRAASEQKTVFLHLGAPWCPWCHKLDDFLARKDVAEIMGVDFIDLKIDVDRMKQAKGVVQRVRKSDEGGIPWFALLDAKASVLATSDGPKGNIGYPAEPEEIAHFMGALKKATKRISADQLGQIEKSLKDAAAKLKTPSTPPQK